MLPLFEDWLPQAIGSTDPAAVWLPGALFLGTFASEDLACVGAGLLVAKGALSFPVAVASCAAGIFVSDLGLYILGRAAVAGIVRWRWVRDRLPTGGGGHWRRAFDRHGGKFLFASRFLPGTRLPAYLTAGAIGWSFGRFAVILGIAVLLWTPILVGLAATSGAVIEDALESYGRYAWLAAPAAFLVAWILARLLPLGFTWRGRRLLLGKARRLTRFEYWPPLVVYPPVVLELLWQGVRRRSLTLFTACNPGIPHGGMVLESKGDILDQLPADPAAPAAVAAYARLSQQTPLDLRLAVVEPFLRPGPAILKPDQGERGTGVAVIRNIEEARVWLEACPFDAIVQEYVEGPEFGVVWRRRPDGTAEIRSIARKIPPAVFGDGVRNLEELILGDDREVAMARFHLARQMPRLDDVPGPGERVSLGELGTHARGASFVDARELWTPELQQALDACMASAPGLDFGRFDLCAPSDQDFVVGRQLRILEFNGVTGEPAHVYHPGYPWYRGIADLCSHWRAACETGAANRAGGHRPTSVWRLLALIPAMRRRPRFEAPVSDLR